jgi:hypothetical protein
MQELHESFYAETRTSDFINHNALIDEVFRDHVDYNLRSESRVISTLSPDTKQWLSGFSISDLSLVRELRIMETSEQQAAKHALYGGKDSLDSIHRDAIHQGHVGNCYLVAAIASLAQVSPQTIRDMITIDKDGTYWVKFKGQEPVPVSAPQEDLGGWGPDGIWPAILVRAYGQILSGNTSAPMDKPEWETHRKETHEHRELKFLSGTHRVNVINNEVTLGELEQHLTMATKGGCLVTAGTGGCLEKYGDNKPQALLGGHSYTVVDYDPQTKTVTVRDPWGKRDAWGGMRTISLEDFQQWFVDVNYAKVR